MELHSYMMYTNAQKNKTDIYMKYMKWHEAHANQ